MQQAIYTNASMGLHDIAKPIVQQQSQSLLSNRVIPMIYGQFLNFRLFMQAFIHVMKRKATTRTRIGRCFLNYMYCMVHHKPTVELSKNVVTKLIEQFLDKGKTVIFFCQWLKRYLAPSIKYRVLQHAGPGSYECTGN